MMPLQITFHGLDPSDALSDLVRDRFAKLRGVSDRIMHCRTAIELPNHSHRHGTPFRVNVQLRVPGHELVVTEEAEDAYAAVGQAFDHMRRRLLEAAH